MLSDLDALAAGGRLLSSAPAVVGVLQQAHLVAITQLARAADLFDPSCADLSHGACRFIQAASDGLLGTALHRPKVAAMAVPPDSIRSFDYSAVSPTAPVEAVHKEVEAGVQFTKRHKDNMLSQVLPLANLTRSASCLLQPPLPAASVEHETAGRTTSVSRGPVSKYVLSPQAGAQVINNADRSKALKELISALVKAGTGTGFVRPTLQLACLSSDHAATGLAGHGWCLRMSALSMLAKVRTLLQMQPASREYWAAQRQTLPPSKNRKPRHAQR